MTPLATQLASSPQAQAVAASAVAAAAALAFPRPGRPEPGELMARPLGVRTDEGGPSQPSTDTTHTTQRSPVIVYSMSGSGPESLKQAVPLPQFDKEALGSFESTQLLWGLLVKHYLQFSTTKEHVQAAGEFQQLSALYDYWERFVGQLEPALLKKNPKLQSAMQAMKQTAEFIAGDFLNTHKEGETTKAKVVELEGLLQNTQEQLAAVRTEMKSFKLKAVHAKSLRDHLITQIKPAHSGIDEAIEKQRIDEETQTIEKLSSSNLMARYMETLSQQLTSVETQAIRPLQNSLNALYEATQTQFALIQKSQDAATQQRLHDIAEQNLKDVLALERVTAKLDGVVEHGKLIEAKATDVQQNLKDALGHLVGLEQDGDALRRQVDGLQTHAQAEKQMAAVNLLLEKRAGTLETLLGKLKTDVTTHITSVQKTGTNAVTKLVDRTVNAIENFTKKTDTSLRDFSLTLAENTKLIATLREEVKTQQHTIIALIDTIKQLVTSTTTLPDQVATRVLTATAMPPLVGAGVLVAKGLRQPIARGQFEPPPFEARDNPKTPSEPSPSSEAPLALPRITDVDVSDAPSFDSPEESIGGDTVVSVLPGLEYGLSLMPWNWAWWNRDFRVTVGPVVALGYTNETTRAFLGVRAEGRFLVSNVPTTHVNGTGHSHAFEASAKNHAVHYSVGTGAGRETFSNLEYTYHNQLNPQLEGKIGVGVEYNEHHFFPLFAVGKLFNPRQWADLKLYLLGGVRGHGEYGYGKADGNGLLQIGLASSSPVSLSGQGPAVPHTSMPVASTPLNIKESLLDVVQSMEVLQFGAGLLLGSVACLGYLLASQGESRATNPYAKTVFQSVRYGCAGFLLGTAFFVGVNVLFNFATNRDLYTKFPWFQRLLDANNQVIEMSPVLERDALVQGTYVYGVTTAGIGVWASRKLVNYLCLNHSVSALAGLVCSCILTHYGRSYITHWVNTERTPLPVSSVEQEDSGEDKDMKHVSSSSC